MKNLIKKTLTQTCVVNTVIITLLYIIGYVTNLGGGTSWIPKFNIMWMVLGVSFVVALAERILESAGSFWFRVICNFALCMLGFMLIFIVGGGYGDNGAAVVIGSFLFFLAYILVNGVRFAVMARREKKENEEAEYESVFKK